jgi:hypothetical protein
VTMYVPALKKGEAIKLLKVVREIRLDSEYFNYLLLWIVLVLMFYIGSRLFSGILDMLVAL